MKLKDTPCYQCLVLAICKNRALNFKLDSSHTSYVQASIIARRLKCDLLYSYIQPVPGNIPLGLNQRRLAIHFLTGYDIGHNNHIYSDIKGLVYTMEDLYDRVIKRM